MTPESAQRYAYVACFVVISVATTGFFIGLQPPMVGKTDSGVAEARLKPADQGPLMDSMHYAELPGIRDDQRSRSRESLAELRRVRLEPDQLIEISLEQKLSALAVREKTRAFNGAPPTIPHSIEQLSARNCVACHSDGAKTVSFRIPQMSHEFMANCTQCHVESRSRLIEPILFAENSFVGLAAPNGGPRAFDGAPPQIPHSTWMRSNCLSCHGETGQYGIRTTHPWRLNCQQCHAPSSQLEQIQLFELPEFVAPPKILSPSDSERAGNND